MIHHNSYRPAHIDRARDQTFRVKNVWWKWTHGDNNPSFLIDANIFLIYLKQWVQFRHPSNLWKCSLRLMNLISLNIFHITKISIYRKISHLYLLEPNFVAGVSGLTFNNNEKKQIFCYLIQWWCQFNGNGYPLKSPNCKLNDYSR